MTAFNRTRRDWLIWLAIFFVALSVRAVLIWFTRPEFAGWFNHTYYYFVQVRGLLVGGSLPFSDLPLLFYLYAAASKLLTGLGIGLEPAIVNGTRLVMTAVSPLPALPVYLFLRDISGDRRLSFRFWVLTAVSAFLPLSIVHMPELLQKNVLGLFLFAALALLVYRSLEKVTPFRTFAIVLVVGLISLSHFGTLAVAVLSAVSLSAALLWVEGTSRRALTAVSWLAALLALSTGALWFLAPERLFRVGAYLQESVPNSLIGRLFAEGTYSEKPLLFAGIAVPFLVAVFLVRIYSSHRSELSRRDSVFWLSSIIFLYLLAAPVLDTALIPRLLLFAAIPLIFVIAFIDLCVGKRWLSWMLTSALALTSLTMGFGEMMGVLMRNGSNREIQAELAAMKAGGVVRPDDLIITTYGINPICNWFLGTKSGLITAFGRDDLGRYRKVFVLETDTVPDEDSPVDKDGDGSLSDSEKYRAMRRKIILPQEAVSVSEAKNFRLFELRWVPSNWKFDRDGNWIGYE